MDHTESNNAEPSFSGKRLLSLAVFVLIVAAAAYWYGVNSIEPTEPPALWMVGLDNPVEHRLDSKYSDADGDLVADPPKDSEKWIDPPTITFSYLTSEQDSYADVWSNFLSFVSEKCGRPITFVRQDSADGQLRAIQQGELHMAGINSGSVPLAVNYCGFVPVCSFGSNDQLATYTMKIIARKDSSIDKPEAIGGRVLALTESTSNSGWKSPMILLLREYKLKPLLDYDIVQMRTHANSINAIAEGKQEVAAIASDELALAVSRGLIAEDDYLEIYESEPFCNNVLGYTHRLKPELAEAIKNAIYEFDWKDSKLAEKFTTIGASQLVPINYQRDFEIIRQIDDAMGRRHAIEERVELKEILQSDP